MIHTDLLSLRLHARGAWATCGVLIASKWGHVLLIADCALVRLLPTCVRLLPWLNLFDLPAAWLWPLESAITGTSCLLFMLDALDEEVGELNDFLLGIKIGSFLTEIGQNQFVLSNLGIFEECVEKLA